MPLSVVLPDGTAESTEMAAVPNQPGFFETSLSLRKPGEHRLQLLEPETSHVIERRIVVDVPEREFADPRMNRMLLESLTRETGGKMLTLAQLADLPDLLQNRAESTVVTGTEYSLWDNPWLLMAIVMLLGTEWILRKWAYLA